MKPYGRSLATLPPAAGMVSLGALAGVFACEIGVVQKAGPVCPCPVPLSLLMVVCVALAACVVFMALSRWNLFGMLEAGFACGLATGASVAAGVTSIEGAFDLSLNDPTLTNGAVLSIALGAVSAIAVVVVVTLLKWDHAR